MNATSQTNRMVSSFASRLGVEEAALMAVIHVESNGKSLMGGLVPIRWEGHYFWRLLPEDKRDQARLAGLAHPRSRVIKNPRSMSARYKMLDRAAEIDEEAAYKSISMGVGQVMGEHAQRLGFVDVFEMWEVNQEESGQLETILRYVENFGLVDELQRHDWVGFARGYNGPAFRRNRYDEKLADAYAMFNGSYAPKLPAKFLRIGDKRKTQVKALQKRLSELGYHVRVDGDFGLETKRQVQIFQADHDLETDGVVGPLTREALDQANVRPVVPERANATVKDLKPESRIVKTGSRIRATGVTVAGGAAAVETADRTGVMDNLSVVTEKAHVVTDAIGPFQMILEFLMANWWVGLIAGGLIFGWWGNKVISARLEDHRTGKTV